MRLIARDTRSKSACSHFRSPSSAGGGDLVFLSDSDYAALSLVGVSSCHATMLSAVLWC